MSPCRCELNCRSFYPLHLCRLKLASFFPLHSIVFVASVCQQISTVSKYVTEWWERLSLRSGPIPNEWYLTDKKHKFSTCEAAISNRKALIVGWSGPDLQPRSSSILNVFTCIYAEWSSQFKYLFTDETFNKSLKTLFGLVGLEDFIWVVSPGCDRRSVDI